MRDEQHYRAQYRPSELSWLFAIHDALPGIPSRVVEQDGRVTLHNDSKIALASPAGFISYFPRILLACARPDSRRLYRGGTKVREDRPIPEHVTYDTPAIVDLHVFEAVESIFAKNVAFGAPGRAKGKGASPKHLLTGHSRCAVCRGPITVANRKYGQANTKVYVCGWRRDRGSVVCTNASAVPVIEVNEAVVEGVKRYLTPQITDAVIKQLGIVLQKRLNKSPVETQQLATEARTLKREIDRFTVALASVDDKPTAVIQAIADKEKRLRHVEAQLATMESSLNTVDLELRRLEHEAHRRLADFHREFDGLARARPQHLRQARWRHEAEVPPGERAIRDRRRGGGPEASTLRNRRSGSTCVPSGI